MFPFFTPGNKFLHILMSKFGNVMQNLLLALGQTAFMDRRIIIMIVNVAINHDSCRRRDPDDPSASSFTELREEVHEIKGQLQELKQMMRVSFDLQLDIQRAIRQEVAAALAAFCTPPLASGAASGGPVPAAVAGKPMCMLEAIHFDGYINGLRRQLQWPSMRTSTVFPAGARGRSGNLQHDLGSNARVADSGNCVICSEATIDSVVYRCGHMCVCMPCGLELKGQGLKCPICRAPITEIVRAYTSMLWTSECLCVQYARLASHYSYVWWIHKCL